MIVSRILLSALIVAVTSILFEASAQEREECILDEPKAIFKKGGFRYDRKTRIWRERLKLDEAITLTVETIQCENVSRKFTFEVRPAPESSPYVTAPYTRAIELLSRLEAYPQAEVNAAARPFLTFSDAKKALKAYADLVANPRLREELTFRTLPESGFSETVAVDTFRKNDVETVAITLTSGPY